mgnify:FL=1
MPQDAFTLLHAARELNNLLSGAKVNRVVQPDKDDVYLAVYTKSGARTLVLSSNAEYCRVAFTSAEKPKPQVAPSFCMLLRKHLLGAETESVSLVGFERIIKIDFRTKNDFKDSVVKTMYCEIMGKYSNLILTENGKILGCIKNAPLDVATTRLTLPGADYVLPKSQDKADITDETSFKSRYMSAFFGDLPKFLFENVKGLSFVTAEEIAANVPADADVDAVYDAVKTFYLSPVVSPCVKGEGKKRDYYITDYKTIGGQTEYFATITDAEDDVFSAKERKKAFDLEYKRISDKVNSLTKKLGKKLQGENEKLLSSANYDELRVKGELITANLYRLEKGMKSCELENYYDDYKPMKITLDENLTPNANAQRYFKKYAKEKRAVEIVTPQKEQTEKDLDYLGSVGHELSLAADKSDFKDIEEELISQGLLPAPKNKSVKTAESPYREYIADGYAIKCGKNNLQNDRLLSRAYKDDLWLHAKGFHSPFVIVETKGEKIPDEVIKTAAEICAYYSDGGKGGKVHVDYCLRKFVKKPPKAKPGSVIYTDYKTACVQPLPHDEIKK